MMFNGLLGGLVAITACADVVGIHAASAVGFLGGVAVIAGSLLLEKLELDDAVDAVPVHGVAGIVGVLATGLWARESLLQELAMNRAEFLLVQVLGALTCCVWSYTAGRFLWRWIGEFTQLRVGETEERLGMNYSEHQLPLSSPTAAAQMAAAQATRVAWNASAGSGSSALTYPAFRTGSHGSRDVG